MSNCSENASGNQVSILSQVLSTLSKIRRDQKYRQIKNIIEDQKYLLKSNLVISDDLLCALKSFSIDAPLIELHEGREVIGLLTFQAIVIDMVIAESVPESLVDLKKLLKDCQIRFVSLFTWQDLQKFIVYADYFGLLSWRKMVDGSSLDWNDITPLDRSLKDCAVSIDDICVFLERVVLKHPNDGALSGLGRTIKEKLSSDPVLRKALEEHIDAIIRNKDIKRFLPNFISGLVHGNEEKFDVLLDQLKESYSDENLFNILYAFGVCCPISKGERFDGIVRDEYKAAKISRQNYLAVSAMRRVVDDGVTFNLHESLRSNATEADLHEVYNYLYDLSERSQSSWYKGLAMKLFSFEEEKMIGRLNFLLYELSEKNLDLVYAVLAERFRSLGSKCFLGEHLEHIFEKDIERFQFNLSSWLNSDSRKTHSAILKICSGRVSSEHCRISPGYFLPLPVKEKVYICLKIAGYVYSMEHLQSLLFSILDISDEQDKILLTNLFSLFRNYLIYNYRSTLDLIKERLASESLKPHHKLFFQALMNYYDQYFEQLNLVGNFIELRCDAKLSEYLRFYRQQQFSDSMKESDKGTFLDMLKPVSLHSSRWAIRRNEEKKHEVMPLGLIQHSMEFPSGEKLDPIAQESLRRTYQKITKDEINIS